MDWTVAPQTKVVLSIKMNYWTITPHTKAALLIKMDWTVAPQTKVALLIKMDYHSPEESATFNQNRVSLAT
eukprot:13261432-Ditylum_brightwellii.AAC.1